MVKVCGPTLINMAPSHWLDPLARRVLEVTGQLPPRSSSANQSGPLAEAWPELEALPEVTADFTIDVNRATREQWCELPGCTGDMADLLVRLQQGGVQFAAADDLFRLLELPSHLTAIWEPHLLFCWYGDAPSLPDTAPVDLNSAAPIELQALGWPDDRLQQLLAARRRASFKDLADLQQRLSLPASHIEALIGRVCFGTRKAGPSLPPRL